MRKIYTLIENNEKKQFSPGSFDPITLGHYDIIERGVTLFDELIIAIGINADKKNMFSLAERKKVYRSLLWQPSKNKSSDL